MDNTPALIVYNVVMDFPSYVSGFVDGEGCFLISFTLRGKLNTGIEVRPSFSISQNERNLGLLKKIHVHFQCGAIRYSRGDRTYKYEVRSLDEIIKKIIPHFLKYPLFSSKQKDFEKFQSICEAMKKNHHRNKSHLIEIIETAYGMNPSGKRKYIKGELLKLLVR